MMICSSEPDVGLAGGQQHHAVLLQHRSCCGQIVPLHWIFQLILALGSLGHELCGRTTKSASGNLIEIHQRQGLRVPDLLIPSINSALEETDLRYSRSSSTLLSFFRSWTSIMSARMSSLVTAESSSSTPSPCFRGSQSCRGRWRTPWRLRSSRRQHRAPPLQLPTYRYEGQAREYEVYALGGSTYQWENFKVVFLKSTLYFLVAFCFLKANM